MIEKTVDVWVIVWVDSWEYLMVLLSVVVLVVGQDDSCCDVWFAVRVD